MRPYKLNIAANEELAVFVGDGSNYVHLSETATVKVKIADRDGNQEFELSAGDSIVLNPFNEIHVSHNGGLTSDVVLYVGRDVSVQTSKVTGIVEVSKIVSQNAAEQFYYRANSNVGLQTVILPAANTNGVRITSIGVYAPSNSVRVGMSKTTPLSYSGFVPFVGVHFADVANNFNRVGDNYVSMPINMPKGYGVYEWPSSAGSGGTIVDIAYEIL